MRGTQATETALAMNGVPLPSRAQVIVVVLISLLVTGLACISEAKQSLGIDFVQYWSAAKVLRGGGNPYDETLLLPVQVAHYTQLNSAIRMWNPPIALTFALPFSFLEYRTALFLWMNGIIIITGLSVVFLLAAWQRESFSKKQIYVLGVFLATFFPAASALAFGQISAVLLAGFVGWLCMRRAHPLLAGIALSLTLCKPHLLYLVYLAILVNSLRNRRFSEIFGVLIGAGLLLATPLLLQPEVLSWYAQAATSPPIYFKTPTLGSWLQWAEILPPALARSLPTALVGASFLLVYILQPSKRFNVLLLVPISVISSPYGWPFDQIMLLPVALQVIQRVFFNPTRWSNWVCGSLIGGNLLGIATAAGNGMEIFVWYPLVLTAIYLWSSSPKSAQEAL